jgi:hypothetical protein
MVNETNRPKTINQLAMRLEKIAYVEAFPFGKHKGKLVADVAKIDPNYVVWWSYTIERCPLDPKVVNYASKHYRELPRGSGMWQGCFDEWDHWGDSWESVAGDPWDPVGPFG